MTPGKTGVKSKTGGFRLFLNKQTRRDAKTGCQKKQLKGQNITAESYSAPHALARRHLVSMFRNLPSGTARRNSSHLMTVADDSADSLRPAIRDESFPGHSQKYFQKIFFMRLLFNSAGANMSLPT
jgi:hypothetical protein